MMCNICYIWPFEKINDEYVKKQRDQHLQNCNPEAAGLRTGCIRKV